MIIYILLKITQVVVLILPLKLSYGLASVIADLHYYTSKRDRNLVINNLRAVFGRDDKNIRRLARMILRNFGKYLVEFLRFSKMGKEYIEKNVTVEGIDNLKEALDAGKGALVFSAHLGNWEWGAAILAQSGYPISVIALAHKDKTLNDFFIGQRALKGVGNIPLGGSVRKTLALLARNKVIGILADRDFSNNAIPIQLFGRIAYMPVGTGLFAVMSRCALIPTFVVRQDENKYKLILEKQLEYTLTGNKQADIERIVQSSARIIEKYIKLYPEQWFIFDDPWKKRG